MPIITNLEDKILQLVRSNQYQWFTVGVNLGGVSGIEGGSGIPLGGFVGQLIQSKVTYDTSEAISLDIPASGVSLVHNLNRIRYWIDQKNPALIVEDEGVEIASGVTTMDFVGAPVEVTLSGGKVVVTVSGTGGGEGGEIVKVSSDDTVANYLDDKVTVVLPITKTVNNPGGNEDLELGFDGDLDDLSDVSIITAVSGEVLTYTDEWLNLTLAGAGISAIGHTHVETDVTDLEHDAIKLQGTDISSDSPSNHDMWAYSSGGEWVPSGVPIGSIDVQEDDTPKVSDATVLNFEGGAIVTDEGGGKATILISGGTGGSSYTYALEDVTGQVPGAGDDYTLAATPASGSLSVHLNGLTQQPNNYNIITGGFHTDFTAIAGDELVASYYTDVPSENILGLTLEVEDADVSVATNVEVLNFEGMEVTDEGGGKVTISGGTGSGGGGDVSVEDEGGEITSGVTSLNFVGSMVEATNVGDDVTVTLSGVTVDMPEFRGVRLYKSTDQTVIDDGSWHEVSWNSELYDEGGLHTGTNDYIEIPANDYGYYRFTGSISFDGTQPTAGIYQLAIFKDWTGISSMFEGNYASPSGIYTLATSADFYCNDTADYRIRYICTDAAANVVMMSGIADSYFSAHKIQAVVADLSDTPNCCRIFNNGYDTDPQSDTWTDVDFTNEAYDTNTFWTYASSHYKFTFHDAGYYNVVCKLQTPGNPGSIFNMSSRALLNDTTVIAQTWDKILDNSNYNQGRTLFLEFDYYFEEDDYIEFQVWQDSGGQVTDFVKPDGGGADSYVAIHQIYGD